jgi:hypothetical protein
MTAPVSVNVSSGVAISARSTSKSPGDHVGIFNLAASGGTNNAGLNVVSANTAFSACEVSGHETAHGTLKISHVNPGPDAASDVNAAAISIDLQAGAADGTAAQGIFLKVHNGWHIRKDFELCRFRWRHNLCATSRRVIAVSTARHATRRHRSRIEALQCWRYPWCGRCHWHIRTDHLKTIRRRHNLRDLLPGGLRDGIGRGFSARRKCDFRAILASDGRSSRNRDFTWLNFSCKSLIADAAKLA